MKISLPWPNSGLNPNVRLHWAVEAKLKKSSRRTAYILTKGQKIDLSDMDAVNVKISFYPPDDKRRRDKDNMISSFKSAQDGIADAVRLDDSKWIPKYFVGKPEKNGRVVVEFLRW